MKENKNGCHRKWEIWRKRVGLGGGVGTGNAAKISNSSFSNESRMRGERKQKRRKDILTQGVRGCKIGQIHIF